MRAAARYLKGCEMLEPYAVKVARTVLRRGGASNRFLLSLQHRNLVKICVISSVDKKLHHRLPNRLPPPFGVILLRNAWMATPT